MIGNRTTSKETKRIERKHEQLDEILTRLQLGPIVRSDFPDIPHRTFYTRIRELVNTNQAKMVGRGRYVSMDYDPLVGQIVGYFEEVAYKLSSALLPKQGVLKWSASRTTLKRLAKLHGRSPDDRQFIDCYWKAYQLFRVRFDPKRSWTKSDAELRQVKSKEEEDRRWIEDHPEQVDQEERRRYRREMREWIRNGRRGPPPILPLEIEASSMKISKANKLPLPLDLLEGDQSHR
jgi:hypothetical protein